MHTLHVGASQVIVTPPLGTEMAGYVQREGVAEGIVDDLCMQALYLCSGDDSLLLLSLDVLHVDEDFGACVAERLGLPSAHVVVEATHTHAGPRLMRVHDALQADDIEHDEALRAVWLSLAVGAGRWAMRTAGPACVAWGTTTVSGVGGNRNHPDAPVDQGLSVVSFLDTSSNKPLATIVNYACHPTVLAASNLFFATDFVGPLRQALGGGCSSHAASPEQPVVLFLNGAAGDVSTRFQRRAQSAAEAVRLGTMVAEAARATPLQAVPADIEWPLAASALQIALNRRALPDAREAHAIATEAEALYRQALADGRDAGTIRILRTRFEGALRQERLSQQGHHAEAMPPLTVRLWALGPLALVAVPAELFSSLGQQIKQNPAAALTLLAGYSNGYAGYIPDAEGYRGGSYEALSTVFEPGAGEALCAQIRAGLQAISRSAGYC